MVACEDSRVTAKLLKAAGSSRPMTIFHEHSRPQVMEALLERASREAVALVSDAGTPLISDPGFELVRAAHERGVRVTTAPGPSAVIAALSISGLPTDRFMFAGFLQTKAVARAQMLSGLAAVQATLVFYEAPGRLADSLQAMAEVFGPRDAVVIRELTKLNEEVQTGTLSELAGHYAAGTKGEIVIVVAPPEGEGAAADALDDALLMAMRTMPMGRAAANVSAALGLPRAEVYARAMELKKE